MLLHFICLFNFLMFPFFPGPIRVPQALLPFPLENTIISSGLLHTGYFREVHFQPLDIIFYFISSNSGHEQKKKNERYPTSTKRKVPGKTMSFVHTDTVGNLTGGEPH